jgi:hypothetical protein
MWYRWMLVAFFVNGVSAFGARVLQGMGLAESHGDLYLSLWYTTGLVAALALFVVSRQRLLPREIVLGGIMGLFSSGGWFMLMAAIAHGVPGYLVFPVATGGSLSIVSLVGVAVLKERLSAYGYFGIASGIAATVILATV